jgi:hypothetical protein
MTKIKLSLSKIKYCLFLFLFLGSCKEMEFNRIDIIRTLDPIIINDVEIKLQGEVVDFLDLNNSVFGFCISHDNPIPSILDSLVICTKQINSGVYSQNLSGIQYGKKLYYRAFLRNGLKIVYGEVKELPAFYDHSIGLVYLGYKTKPDLSFVFNTYINRHGFFMPVEVGLNWSVNAVLNTNSISGNISSNGDTIICSVLELPLDTPINFRGYYKLSNSNVIYSGVSIQRINTAKVETENVSLYSIDSVVVWGVIEEKGVFPIDEVGFCWISGSNVPTINDNKILVSYDKDKFMPKIIATLPLMNARNIRIRAFVKSGKKVNYGKIVEYNS